MAVFLDSQANLEQLKALQQHLNQGEVFLDQELVWVKDLEDNSNNPNNYLEVLRFKEIKDLETWVHQQVEDLEIWQHLNPHQDSEDLDKTWDKTHLSTRINQQGDLELLHKLQPM